MNYYWMSISGCLGFLGVALGAFGAHALKDRLDSYSMGVFQTAVHYHLIHTVVLFALSIGLTFIPRVAESGAANLAAWAFTIGILIFSGSLYTLAVTGISKLGAITPVGGLSFLIGWGAIITLGLKLLPKT